MHGCLINGLNKSAITSDNRLKIDDFSKVIGHDNIYAIGDIAAIISEKTPYGHPQLAPVAMQQGERLAKNFKQFLSGKNPLPFRYHDKGSLATIGRNKAVADLPKIRLHGFIAWITWIVVHIFYLIGFRNKVIVMIDWVWSYLSYNKAIRLIIRPFRRE